MMVRRDAFEQVGLFTEDYFMYAEDLDLCYKLVRAGYQNYYTGDTCIIHFGGRSSDPGAVVGMQWNSKIQYAIRNHGRAYSVLFRCALIVAALVRIGLLGCGCVFHRRGDARRSTRTSSRKWAIVLKLLLSHSDHEDVAGRLTVNK